MKIVVVLGSPRPQGNSAVLAQRLLDAAEGLGAEVQKFFVNKMDFKGVSGVRILQDDQRPVYFGG